MNLPRINYLTNGPAAPERSLDAAAAPARAMGQIGSALESIGERGFRIAQQVRVTKEAGDRAKFMSEAEKAVAAYESGLLVRSDFDQFGKGIKEVTDELRSKAADLSLSPEGRAILDRQFLDLSTRSEIRIETQAALRMNREAWAAVGNRYNGMIRDRNRASLPEVIDEYRKLGATPSQTEELERSANQKIDLEELNLDADDYPERYIEILPEAYPHLSSDDIDRLQSRAKNRMQELRTVEVDDIEDRIARNEPVQKADIEGSPHLTHRDKQALTGALWNRTPPDKEAFASAWKATDTLRAAWQDPGISKEQYRELYNEAHATVLGRIPPSYQGELKQQLGLLAPAGRDPSQPLEQAGSINDELMAIARGQIGRERDAHAFGRIGADVPKQEREAAYRRAEDLSLEAGKFIRRTKDLDATKVRTYVDGLVSGSKTTTTAKDLKQYVPGLGGPLRGKSAIPFGQAPSEPDGVLPFKDGSLPSLSPADAGAELERALEIPKPSPPTYLNR